MSHPRRSLVLACLALGCAGCEARDLPEIALFVIVMAAMIWLVRRALMAEQRYQARKQWLLRNGRRADARIVSMRVTASSPRGKEPSQLIRFSLELDAASAPVSATIMVPLAEASRLREGGALPVCFDPAKPSDLAVDWSRLEA